MNIRLRSVLFIVLILTICMRLSAQGKSSKYEIHASVGSSLLGSGDVIAYNYETGINYIANKFFSFSMSLNFGKGKINPNDPDILALEFIQGNFNCYLFPLKTTSPIGIKMGSGLSLHDLSKVTLNYITIDQNTGREVYIYNRVSYSTFGLNFILEPYYRFKNGTVANLKFYFQRYRNRGTNIGYAAKLSYRL